jgi:hypothetical protein
MGRPLKQKVEFFSHDSNAHNKKTLKALRFHFKNDGYTFWFVLLELLGDTEGHYIDCRNTDEWEFLVSETQVDGDFCDRILNLLVNLKAIDKELWTKHRVVWSQNFVNRLKSVYDKRHQELPLRPSFCHENPMAAQVSGAETTQRERESKESKERERISQGDFDKSPFLPLAKRILENAKANNPTLEKGVGYDERKKLASFVKDLSLLKTRTWPHLLLNEAVALANKVWDWVLVHEGSNGFRWRDVIESGESFYKGCSPHMKGGGKLISQYNAASGKTQTPCRNQGPAVPSKSGERTFEGGD